MHPFDLIPPTLEQGLRPLEALESAMILPSDAPYARARVLMMLAMERYSVGLSHHLLSALPDQDARRNLALIQRIDMHQEASLSILKAHEENPLEQSVLLSMLALELSAVLAQRMPEGEMRQALHFVIPEFLDEVYRLSNLMMLTENKPAQQFTGGYVEIMPGRPLMACQRHPYDEVRFSGTPGSILEEMTPLVLAAVCAFQQECFLQSARLAENALSRSLYLELSLIAGQHQVHFESLPKEKSPLERLLLCQYTEGYLYDSCAQEEDHAPLRHMYIEERDHELAHIRKAADLLAQEKGENIPLPEFPDRLRLGPNKGYVRDVLQHVGLTALREGYAAVGQLPQGADFFRYQQRLCPREEQVPSHQVISRLIEKTGEDYRFEIALHPIEALRNRQKDNIQVGR